MLIRQEGVIRGHEGKRVGWGLYKSMCKRRVNIIVEGRLRAGVYIMMSAGRGRDIYSIAETGGSPTCKGVFRIVQRYLTGSLLVRIVPIIQHALVCVSTGKIPVKIPPKHEGRPDVFEFHLGIEAQGVEGVVGGEHGGQQLAGVGVCVKRGGRGVERRQRVFSEGGWCLCGIGWKGGVEGDEKKGGEYLSVLSWGCYWSY